MLLLLQTALMIALSQSQLCKQQKQVFINGIDQLYVLDKQTSKLLGNSTIAKATYCQDIQKVGWNILEVEGMGQPNQQQFYLMGYLEGYLTFQQIEDAYYNFVMTQLDGQYDVSEKVKDFINQQNQYIEQNKDQNKKYMNAYLLLQQVKGLFDGYQKGSMGNGKIQTELQIYLLTYMGDLAEVLPAMQYKKKEDLMECTIIMKLNKDNRLLVGHNTHNIYSLMLRIYKKYKYGDQRVIEFSSRPGDLQSKDDFYRVQNQDVRMIVMETSFNTYDESLYERIDRKGLPAWMRGQLANLMANNSQQWVQIFTSNNSGTHNSQWIIVDVQSYHQKQEIQEGMVMMVEQFYDLINIQDMSSQLKQQQYLGFYNTPINEQIYQLSKYQQYYKFNYHDEPRGLQIKQRIDAVENPIQMVELLGLNGGDQYGVCGGISPRCDLDSQNKKPFGGVDVKVTDDSWDYVLIQNGPTKQQVNPFRFADGFSDYPHKGIPEIMDFPVIKLIQ